MKHTVNKKMIKPSQMQKKCKHSCIDIQIRLNKGFQRGICEECGSRLVSNDFGQTFQQT